MHVSNLKVLSWLKDMPDLIDTLKLKDELLRKLIHMATAVIPLSYFFGIEKQIIIAVCIILSIGFLIVDILRMNFDLVRKYFLVIFSNLLRGEETRNRLTGATFLFIGMTITFLLFNKQAAIPAVLLLNLADTSAAVIGKAFGKKQIIGKKTWFGSLGFLITGALVILMFTDFYWVGFAVVLLTAAVEIIPQPINDNLLIPVFSGFLLHIFG